MPLQAISPPSNNLFRSKYSRKMYIQRFFIHTPLFLSLSKTGLLPANIILHGICIPIPSPLFTAFPVISTVAEFNVSVRRKHNTQTPIINYPGFFEPPIFELFCRSLGGSKNGGCTVFFAFCKIKFHSPSFILIFIGVCFDE